jgi:hypothetical protein
MPEFMEGYGVADARRARIIKRVALATLAVLVIGGSAYFYFRTWNEKRLVDRFLTRIEQQDLAGAYAMWCTPREPCPYYTQDQFQRDWGPGAPYSNVSAATIEDVDFCDSGVVFNIAYPNAEPVGLWVERASGVISFAPWLRCPASKRLDFGPLMERLFGSSNKG